MKQVSRAIITNEEGKVMLGQRSQGLGEGLYALIGGKPDQGESAKEAIVREVKEETGLTFLPTYYLEEVDRDSDSEDPWKVTYFTGTVTGDVKLEPSEIREIIYVSEHDLDLIPIAFNHKEKLKEFFQSRYGDSAIITS